MKNPQTTPRSISQHSSEANPTERQLVIHQTENEIERLMNSHSLTNIRPSEDNQCPNTPSTQGNAVEQLAPHDTRGVLHTNRSSTQDKPSQSSDLEHPPLDPTRVVHAPDGTL